ncbi:MAG: DNA methyltransferase [Candidatus Eremiobacterota bacterium]
MQGTDGQGLLFSQPTRARAETVRSRKRSSAETRGRLHPRNQLNELTGTEWIRFTRSWFVVNPPRRSRSEIQHPAKFPEDLVDSFIRFFTRRGQWVLDPFAGVGSTLSSARSLGRRAAGVELSPRYYELARQQLGPDSPELRLHHGDAREVSSLGLPPVDFVMTSPPYWDMLANSRGNVLSVHKKRRAAGLDVVYSHEPGDLGNLTDYEGFLAELTSIFRGVVGMLKTGGYLVVVIQNLRSPQGRMVPLAWDLARELDRFVVFKGERIWCQDNKPLGIWGYPSEFVSNVHHHYCLVFKKSVLP